MKYFIYLSYPILLFLVFLVLLLNENIRNTISKNKKGIFLFLILNIVLINLFLILHLRQESFIPYWDFGGFWKRSLEFNQMLDRSITEAMDNLLYSIRYTEYSFVPALLSSFATKLVGNSFPRFIIAMYNSFLLPANLLLYIMSLMIIEKDEHHSVLKKILCGILISGFGGNYYSMVFGYTGSAGLPFITAVLLLVYAGGLENFKWRNNIMIGLIMILLLVIRRWFAYWIVGFYIAYCIAYLVREGKSLTRNKFMTQFANMMVCGLIPLSILLICFMPLFKTIVTYNYAEAYSVAKMGGAGFIIGWFIEYYGWFIVALFVTGLVLGLKNRKMRMITVMAVLQTVIAIVLFNRVQSFGSHHYYIINVPVLIVALIGMTEIVSYLKKQIVIAVIVIFSLLTTANFSKTVVFGNDMIGNPVYGVLNRILPAPFPDLRIRNDLDKIRSMAKFLDEVPQEYEYVYTLSSSVLFNDDFLMNAFLPDKLYGVNNLLVASAYDYRDGIPADFFFYKYIVVADPIQINFGEELQRCVSVLAEFMLDETRSGPYYRVIREEKIDYGITIKIFERIDTVPNSVRQTIIDEYKKYYSDRPEMYAFNLLDE